METHAKRNLRLFDTETPVACVTGSVAPRVGRVVAEHLHALGFRVALHGHSQRELPPAATQCSELQLYGDVQDEAQVAEWVAAIDKQFGRLDVWVNAAAIWDPIPLEECSAADFDRFFRVNTVGTALCCKLAGLYMVAQPSGGAIVNIGDWAVSRPYRDFTAYLASKSAVASVTESMAVELASRNARVRVNCVLPGPVLLADSITAEHRDEIKAACLLQREGRAEDVAEAVVYLATSAFVTGVSLPVDGGRSIYSGPSTDPVAHPDVGS